MIELTTTEDLVQTMGILGEISDEENENLRLISSITKNLIEKKKRCKETIIYRIAMTLYHSDRYWESHIFKFLDDPINIYLKLSTNTKFQKNYENIWTSIERKKDRILKANYIKTLICFIFATYLYYKNEIFDNE